MIISICPNIPVTWLVEILLVRQHPKPQATVDISLELLQNSSPWTRAVGRSRSTLLHPLTVLAPKCPWK